MRRIREIIVVGILGVLANAELLGSQRRCPCYWQSCWSEAQYFGNLICSRFDACCCPCAWVRKASSPSPLSANGSEETTIWPLLYADYERERAIYERERTKCFGGSGERFLDGSGGSQQREFSGSDGPSLLIDTSIEEFPERSRELGRAAPGHAEPGYMGRPESDDWGSMSVIGTSHQPLAASQAVGGSGADDDWLMMIFG